MSLQSPNTGSCYIGFFYIILSMIGIKYYSTIIIQVKQGDQIKKMALINILKQGDQIHLLDQRDPCREFAFNLG